MTRLLPAHPPSTLPLWPGQLEHRIPLQQTHPEGLSNQVSSTVFLNPQPSRAQARPTPVFTNTSTMHSGAAK